MSVSRRRAHASGLAWEYRLKVWASLRTRNCLKCRALKLANVNSETGRSLMVDTVIVTPAATDAGEGLTSAVSWPAILAGGFAAVALSIVLFTLGAGLRLSAVSPWSDRGISSDTAALAGGIYLVVVAVMSSDRKS